MTDSSNANDAAAAELLHDFDVEYDEPAQVNYISNQPKDCGLTSDITSAVA